jgi:hypothetical protein
MTHGRTPDSMPVLARGKHRNPRKGACFMELAAFLAGEPWSDHPACTHPLLAALARDINDQLGDHARRQIAPLVPEVIGLNLRDPAIDALLAREVALAALPLASAERQRVAAVGLLRCERVLNELRGLPAEHVSSRVESALAEVPHARDWARDFCGMGFGRLDNFSRRSAPTIVHSAVASIARAAVDDADQLLVDLLRRSIANCRTWMRHDTVTVAAEQWREACELTDRRLQRRRLDLGRHPERVSSR